MKGKRPRLGAHVSAAGKLAFAIDRAKDIGAECIQIFGASPQQWAVRGHDADAIKAFKSAREKSGIEPVYLHGAYLVNLASADPELRKKSEANLAAHLGIAEAIGAEGVIFHIGSGKGLEGAAAVKEIAAIMKRILSGVKGRSKLVIENSAGGGNTFGDDPEEIGELISAIGSKRIGVCWDTQHAFAAGIINSYNEANIASMVKRLASSFDLGRLQALHINDSKTIFNSHRDRHENLGAGHIGLNGFKALSRVKLFHDAAWILEVPGIEDNGPDKPNMDILKSLFDS